MEDVNQAYEEGDATAENVQDDIPSNETTGNDQNV
jgi:hypothetical protein